MKEKRILQERQYEKFWSVQLWILGVISLFLIVLGFYWFEWQPTNIKKGCSTSAYALATQAPYNDSPTGYNSLTYQNSYNLCIQEKGI